MSYDDALLLTEAGDNWNSLTVDNVTALGYTEYVSGNSIPNYYFTDNIPANDDWSATYTSTLGVAADSKAFITDPQAALITYYLSATSGIDYRVSFADVSNLTFHVSDSPNPAGEIFISRGNITNANTFGITEYPTTNYSTWAGDVVFSDNTNTNSAGLVPNTVLNQTDIGQIGADIILHELAHAIGLLHATGDACYVGDFATQKYTIMTDNPTSNSPEMDPSVHPTDLQLFDIAAVQSLYGVNWGGVRGAGGTIENTDYNKDTAFATDNPHNAAFIYTIWDGAGTDVIDATGYNSAEIDLRQGHFSSIGYKGDAGNTPVAFDSGGVDHGNVAIAYFTVIENAIGSGNDDILIGNAWNNVLSGGTGNDTIYGDGITYDGDAGDHAANTNKDSSGNVLDWGPDAIQYAANLSGDDILIGGAGDDYFYGGKGNDVIHGGYVKADIDSATSGWATYWDAAGQFTGTNNANGMALSNISYSADSTADGTDTVDYSSMPEGSANTFGIDVTFADSLSGFGPTTVIKGYAGEYGTDTLFSIDTIKGTPWNDTFEGTSLTNHAFASAGDDTYLFVSDELGAPTTVDYSSLPLSSHIALTLDSGSGIATVDKYALPGSLGEDTISHPRFIIGTSGDDTFSGFAAGSSVNFYGAAGNDTYSFNMNDLGGAPITSVFVDEDSGGSLNNISVSNFDTVDFYAPYHVFTGNGVELIFEKWNSGLGVYDALEVFFNKGTYSGIESATFGATTFEVGGYTDNIFTGAAGIHFIYGGPGTDTIDYSAATSGVTADLSTGTVSDNGWGYVDTLNNISIIIASHNNDSITGNGTTTTISYADSSSGVNVNLSTGASTGDGSDTLSAVPNVIGSSHDDTIISSSGDNVIDGGAGSNTVSYAAASSSVTVDLSAGTATGDGNDTLINIQNVIGSPNDGDVLAGNSGDNTLDGGGGDDTVSYQSASLAVTVNLLTGTATGDGNDTLLNIGSAIGSQYGDTLTGSGFSNLYGMAGNDTLYGGGVAHYDLDPAGVTVNLATGTATDGWGDTDTLIGIERVTGSQYNDVITADSNDDYLFGGAGNDTYVISAGFGNTDVSENLSSGTDTIHFTGIDPSHIRMYTNSYGWLLLEDTTNPSTHITVFGDTTGSGTDESTVGQHVEQITFDDVNNTVWSLTGGLTLTGTTSGETLYGTGYGDVIKGMGGADTIYGNGGDDTISGGSGNDILDGGTGTDTLSYASATAGVTVNLATTSAQNTVGAGTDTVTNFENLTGSAFNDTLTGDGNANVIDGGAGNDVMNGAGGTDTLSYASATAGITISLAIGTGQATGGSGTDTISNFENLTGSAFGDTLTGDANANVIDGGAGNDIIQGGAGNDTLIGGADIDTVTYAAAASAVTVSLATTSAQATGGAGTDTISGFENLTGSAFADTLTGDGNNNVIEGLAGNDVLAGGLGTDTVTYVDAASAVTVSLATTSAQNTVGAGTDTISGFENLTGSAFNDTLTGDGNNNVIQGLAGNDVLVGGSGTDTVTYTDAASAVTVSLATTSAQNTVGAGTDTISGFENLTGSAFNDTLTGDANANVLQGLAGNDTLSGGAGNDVLDGGAGTDTVTFASAAAGVTVDLSAGTATGDGSDTLTNIENVIGSTHNDVITGNSGNNVLIGGMGDDTIDGGGGIDTLAFNTPGAVTVDLHAGTSTGAGNDTLLNIENVIGTSMNDTIVSSSGDNVLDGGAGTDTISYVPAASHVTVNLSTGTATGDGTDTLSNFENIIGSAYDDTLTGDTNVNTITGGAGNDIITGGGGVDLLYGGTGSDTFLFLAAHAFSAIAKIEDFTSGSGNDKIDIKDVISGYDPATMAITDWVQITTSGANSLLKVDIDGTGTAHTWQQIATIVGVTGLTDEAALVASGNLIVH